MDMDDLKNGVLGQVPIVQASPPIVDPGVSGDDIGKINNDPVQPPKHAGGRPRKYKQLEEFQKKIDEYFAKDGPHGMAGLACALGMSRVELLIYNGRPEFSSAVKNARLKIEAEVEAALMTKTAPAGAIFNLTNNFGWKQPTQQVESKNENTNKVTIHSALTEEELDSKLLKFEQKTGT